MSHFIFKKKGEKKKKFLSVSPLLARPFTQDGALRNGPVSFFF